MDNDDNSNSNKNNHHHLHLHFHLTEKFNIPGDCTVLEILPVFGVPEFRETPLVGLVGVLPVEPVVPLFLSLRPGTSKIRPGKSKKQQE